MKLKDKAIFKFRRNYYGRKLKKYISVRDNSCKAFEEIISKYRNDNCFIHGGYSSIKRFFQKSGGIDTLIRILDDNFKNILSPAYTLTFKQHGVYHYKYSKPDIGYFGVVFGAYSNFRTLDPIGSVWVRGCLNKTDLDLKNSFFAKNGIYGCIDNKKSLTICLGTDTVMLSLLHYLEQKFQLPYRHKLVYKGIVYYDDSTFEHVEHKTTENIKVLQVERERIEYDMLKEGVMQRYDFGDFSIRVFNNQDFSDFIERKTFKNPYYLFYEKK